MQISVQIFIEIVGNEENGQDAEDNINQQDVSMADPQVDTKRPNKRAGSESNILIHASCRNFIYLVNFLKFERLSFCTCM